VSLSFKGLMAQYDSKFTRNSKINTSPPQRLGLSYKKSGNLCYQRKFRNTHHYFLRHENESSNTLKLYFSKIIPPSTPSFNRPTLSFTHRNAPHKTTKNPQHECGDSNQTPLEIRSDVLPLQLM
jgi:hypothetical protein